MAANFSALISSFSKSPESFSRTLIISRAWILMPRLSIRIDAGIPLIWDSRSRSNLQLSFPWLADSKTIGRTRSGEKLVQRSNRRGGRGKEERHERGIIRRNNKSVRSNGERERERERKRRRGSVCGPVWFYDAKPEARRLSRNWKARVCRPRLR